jgi:hypothetical protein
MSRFVKPATMFVTLAICTVLAACAAPRPLTDGDVGYSSEASAGGR